MAKIEPTLAKTDTDQAPTIGTAIEPSAASSASAGSFPVVGIGASAGGLAAFEDFFSGMPELTLPGMAFVLVQHLAPDHESLLTDLIRRYTSMQVFEIEDGMVVQVNCAYIIPPGRDVAFLNGTLQLLEPTAPRGQRLPIDFFFRSLAQDQLERAIGIVLSGTGSDGTLGVRAIKGAGGMVIAQIPASTEFDGMPRSAIATNLVDYVLAPSEMPSQLMTYVAHAFGKRPLPASAPESGFQNAMQKIFVLLRAQTSHDFSQYKSSTLHRRIDRRLAVHQIESIDSYVKYLQQTPAEVDALFRDLLIGVTNFFRDPEAFQALEHQIIPQVFAGKPAGAVIRVWSTGCSTGEEAYSIAILLHEHMEALKANYKIQVFATDIDNQAIATARAGLYPASIAADLTPERLARYFTAEPYSSTYRIHKGIRDMLIFSKHDLIKDPPFSRLDIISCRNLLIYMGSGLQKKLMPMFQFALNQGGFLFLGTSETIGEFGDLFTPLDRKSKLFQRKEFLHAGQLAAPGRVLPSRLPTEHAQAMAPAKAAPAKPSLRELTEQTLLQHIVPASVLVNARGDIFYLHGRTGMYLEPPPGEAGISNILAMAREGLRNDLTVALRKASGKNEVVQVPGLRIKTNGHFSLVNMSICPAVSGVAEGHETKQERLYLVVLEDVGSVDATEAASTANPAAAGANTPDADARITALMQELRAKDEYLQSTHEELETSNEELKSSNEEMQSVNEELQSTNEELETSKEEMQSINEELATVNAELNTKVIDLSQVNNDMNNLLAGTGIATVFVDHQLHILRFTPEARVIINLILSDIGRPVGHIVSRLVGYDRLVADVQSVLDSLVPKEVAVHSTEGKWYTMRIQPYRTLDNVIEGAVITFIDITEIVRTRETLSAANGLLRLSVVVRDAQDAITMQDLDGRILAWNPGAVRMYGWTEAEALLMNVRDRIPKELLANEFTRVRQLSQAEVLKPFVTRRLTKTGAVLKVSMVCTALVNEGGQMYAIATTERSKEVESVAAAKSQEGGHA